MIFYKWHFWKISLIWKIIFWNPSHISREVRLTGLSKMHTNWKSMKRSLLFWAYFWKVHRNQKFFTFCFMHLFICIFLNIFFRSWYSPNWPWFSITPFTPSQKMNLRQVFPFFRFSACSVFRVRRSVKFDRKILLHYWIL